jgi:hypothetical protein
MILRKTVLATMAFLAIGPGFVSADNILLLGDTDAETQVQAALESAGHTVTFAGYYYDWDGVTPNVNDFDVVVFLNGEDYGYALEPAAATALDSFVAGGCGLVMTEWTAYDVCSDYKGAIIAGLLPVTMGDCGDYGYGDTWTVQDPGHALASGLPASWTDEAGWSTVTTKPGASVIVTGTDGNPLVVTSSAEGGRVVYLNHDMTYTTDTMTSESLQLIVNAAEFASCAEQQIADPIPTVSWLGIAFLASLIGLTAVWVLRHATR